MLTQVVKEVKEVVKEASLPLLVKVLNTGVWMLCYTCTWQEGHIKFKLYSSGHCYRKDGIGRMVLNWKKCKKDLYGCY